MRATRTSQVGVVSGAPAQIGERVVTVGIEPRRHEHPGRLETVDRRSNDFVDGRQGDVAGRAGWQRHVHRQTRSTGTTRFCRRDPCPDTQATDARTHRARGGRPRRCPAFRCRGARPSRRSATRSPASASAAAAIATLFNRQKPIARGAVAWCPGGRTATKAASCAAITQCVDGGQPESSGLRRRRPRSRARRRCRDPDRRRRPRKVERARRGTTRCGPWPAP